MRKSLLLLCGLLFIFPLFAQETGPDFQGKLNNFFQPLLDFLDKILFFDPFAALGFEFGVKIPFIIIWLIFGAVFFTFCAVSPRECAVTLELCGLTLFWCDSTSIFVRFSHNFVRFRFNLVRCTTKSGSNTPHVSP